MSAGSRLNRNFVRLEPGTKSVNLYYAQIAVDEIKCLRLDDADDAAYTA